MSKYFVTCARGLEELAAKELTQIGAVKTEITAGGVYFEGDQALLYKAHLWLRTGNRIFLPLRTFPCRDADDLYENLIKFKWETFLKDNKTFAVECTISGQHNPNLSHSHYAKLRVKDAIVDRMREKTGDRPNVEVSDPDIGILVYIRDGKCTLNMDATGKALHVRGYRPMDAEAPMKETLAAGILLLSGWDPSTALIDPMCGSGTFLVEGALIAANFAPGLFREHFMFMNWPDFYEARWQECVAEAEAAIKPLEAGQFFGFDHSHKALAQTQKSFERVQFEKIVTLQQRQFEQFQLPEVSKPGFLVVNPPYGERLGDLEELKVLYKLMGDTFKHKLKGWKALIFTGNSELAKSVGLKAKRIPLYNGAIESRALIYDLY